MQWAVNNVNLYTCYWCNFTAFRKNFMSNASITADFRKTNLQCLDPLFKQKLLSIYSNSNFMLHFQQMIFCLTNFQLSRNGALGFLGVVAWLHTCTEYAKKILTQGFFYAPTIKITGKVCPWYVPFSPVYPRFLHSSFGFPSLLPPPCLTPFLRISA